MHRTALIPLFLALLVLGACDGLGVSSRDVEGTWLFSGSNLTGGGWSCSIDGLSLSLSQNGRDFSGATSGGELHCVRPDSVIRNSLGTLPVVQGRTSGDSIRFSIGTAEWMSRGVLSGRSVTGTTTLRPDVLSGTEISGPFGAARLVD